MKLISVVTPCYNESSNVSELIERVKCVMEKFCSNYEYEHIFIDNDSTDGTVEVLREICKVNKRIKVIVNSRNFGHLRSPVHAMLQGKGDAIISIVSDLQDPPELIPELIKKWEEGNDSVLAIKKTSQESSKMFKLREFYYSILEKCSEIEIFKNFTGFGLYDRKVMDAIGHLNDPYPFFRGMIAEVGFEVAKVYYDQPIRIKGITKNNFYTLYDIGILGIINNSKIPLRLAMLSSLLTGFFSLFFAFIYFVMKIIYWDTMPLGIAPLVIGSFFMFSILLFLLGLIGEYIGAIYTQVLKRPLVFEKERINFDE